MPEIVQILIADANEHYQNSLRYVFEKERLIQLTAEASNGRELIQLACEHKPNVVITDVQFPGINGIDAISIINKHQPLTSIVALSYWEDAKYIEQAIEAGATGLVCKQSPSVEVMKAVKAAHTNKEYHCSRVAALLEQHRKTKQLANGSAEPLTAKEIEVLQCLSQGMTHAQAGQKTRLKPRTIEDYKERIIKKMGVANFNVAMCKAVHKRIIECPG